MNVISFGNSVIADIFKYSDQDDLFFYIMVSPRLKYKYLSIEWGQTKDHTKTEKEIGVIPLGVKEHQKCQHFLFQKRDVK